MEEFFSNSNNVVWLFFGVMAIDRGLQFLTARGIDLRLVCKQISELHIWHDVNEPGKPMDKLWYADKELAKSIDRQSVAMTKASDAQDRNTAAIGSLDSLLHKNLSSSEKQHLKLDIIMRDVSKK